VGVVLLVLVAGFTAHAWFDGWTYRADDTATAAIERDGAGADATAGALLDQLPSGTCAPASGLELGPLRGTATWEKVCGVGAPDGSNRGFQMIGPSGLTLSYAVDGSPFWTPHSCIRELDGGWLVMFPLDTAEHDRCADGYSFVAGL
jgi:hypothetical protein